MDYPMFQKSKWVTVEDMYNYVKTHNLKLLSNFNEEFWSDYVANSSRYDSLFKRMFKKFRYFDQDPYDENNTVEKVTLEFIDEVYNHLLVNAKKYSELFRINNLSDSDYNIFDNVNYTESKQTNYNESNTYTDGARTDNTSMTKGGRSDTTTATTGARTDTSENKVSAFNDSEYANSDKATDIKGEQTDTTNTVVGEQVDNNNFNKGEQVNSETKNNSSTEQLTRKGKVSNASGSQLINEHLDLWDRYKFYNYIFTEISIELLLI